MQVEIPWLGVNNSKNIQLIFAGQFRQCLPPRFNRCKSKVFKVKFDEFVVLEVHQRNKLYTFTQELLRWRVLLDNPYKQEQMNKRRLGSIYS